MADDVVRVPLERDGRIRPLHPCVESVMQKQIRKARAYDPPYAKDNFRFERVISGWRGGFSVLDLRHKR